MSDTYTHVVILPTTDGRTTYALTSNPVQLLAMRVAEGLLPAKQAGACPVFTIASASVDKAALATEIEFQRLVFLAASNPEPVRKLLLANKMSPEQLEHLRAELTRQALGQDTYASPWPFREERDVPPDEDTP